MEIPYIHAQTGQSPTFQFLVIAAGKHHAPSPAVLRGAMERLTVTGYSITPTEHIITHYSRFDDSLSIDK
ncbi:hypothetical protein E2C01_099957 [Portunus trituberculatus]|uniref:Uncharacterized protein n=1 Tax=Portunus trituberculatus TaxID=210409 RepID=A0A5B7KG68_PORTR|nr:hypothetical protein [Portunus trituberculatus]